MKVGIAGAAGRMGRTLVQAIQHNDNAQLSCASEYVGSDMVGVDAGELAAIGRLGIPVVDTLDHADFDVLISFTTPVATLEQARICQSLNRPMVIGTTGLSDEQTDQLSSIAGDVAIVYAPNMSVGVNLAFRLVELAAKTLQDDVDIEIVEAHHRHKVDAPSGTALRLGEIVARETGRDLQADAVYGREGHTGARERNSIGFSTIRAGDIVGEHTVIFAGDGERIEVTHRASSRMNFANGALRAAAWVIQRDSGLYSMQDVLNLS